jgi:hypothetical protein
MLKVAICSPARDMVHTGFAFDLGALITKTIVARRDIQLGLWHSAGTMIHQQRIDLAQAAVDSGADRVLFIDTDMRFPSDSLLRLLAHGRAIVGANYVTREVPPMPTASVLKDGKDWMKVPTLHNSTGLQEVTGLGMGLILINTEVFKRLPKPWFNYPYSSVNDEFIGEDLWFSMKAADEAGFKTYLDHDLSKEVRHLGLIEYRHEHFEATHDMPDELVISNPVIAPEKPKLILPD